MTGNNVSDNKSYIAVQPAFYQTIAGYHERLPIHPILQQYIGSFYEIITTDTSANAIPVVPDGCMDIIFITDEFTTRPYLLRTAESILGMQVSAGKHVLGIRFKPVGVAQFIRFQWDDSSSSYMVPLEELDVPEALCLHEFNSTYTFEQKCSILERLLLENRIQNDASMELTHKIAEYIISKNGIVSVDALSQEFFYSTRYINKLFNQNAGMSPKKFCEIVQLQNTLGTIYASDERIAEIAAKTGYYDEAHMNHVIRRLLNTTSGKLRNNRFFEEVREDLDIKYFY